MSLKQFIDQYILSPLDPDEKLVVCAGKFQTLPYGIDFNGPEIPEESRKLRRVYDVLLQGELATDVYFSTCTYTLNWRHNTPENPESAKWGIYRRERDARRWIGFVADDVGTKIKLDKFYGITPTFIIESSPTNHQFAYILERPIQNLKLAMAFLLQARDLGLTDAGGLQTTKLVRLPTGVNSKSKYDAQAQLLDGSDKFQVRCVAKSGKRWDLFKLAEAFGMDTAALAQERTAVIGHAGHNVVSMVPNQATDALLRYRSHQRAENAWSLKLLGMLQDHNMVKTPPDEIEARRESLDHSGYIDIVCPWEHEHTTESSTSSTVFSPVDFGPDEYANKVQFQCQHGHCEGRTDRDLKLWAIEKGWLTDEDFRDPTAPTFDQQVAMLLEFKVWCTAAKSDGGIYDVRWPTDAPISYSALRNEYSNVRRDKVTPAVVWLLHSRRLKAKAVDYIPGKGSLIDRPDGSLIFNTWQRSGIVGKPCGERVAKLMDRLFDAITGNEQECEYAKLWLAWAVVHPEQRHRFAWVSVCTIQGTGRGMLASIVKALLGPGDYRLVRAIDINNPQFNDWSERCTFVNCPEFVVTEHIMSRDQRNIFDNIKMAVTETEMEVNAKWGAKQQGKVHCNLFLASNYEDAIRIGEEDRRFMVTMNHGQPQEDQFYHDLAALLKDRDALEQIKGYFEAICRSEPMLAFRHLGRAPLTEGKKTMIEAAKSVVEQAIDELVEQNPGAVWYSHVLDMWVRYYAQRHEGGDYVRHKHIRKLMVEIGGALRKHNYVSGQWQKYVGRQRYRYWRPMQSHEDDKSGRQLFDQQLDIMDHRAPPVAIKMRNELELVLDAEARDNSARPGGGRYGVLRRNKRETLEE